MKKIGKISINPEKVIKNEELVNLRGGGYTFPSVVCKDGDYVCYEGFAASCEDMFVRGACDDNCDRWTSAVCV